MFLLMVKSQHGHGMTQEAGRKDFSIRKAKHRRMWIRHLSAIKSTLILKALFDADTVVGVLL